MDKMGGQPGAVSVLVAVLRRPRKCAAAAEVFAMEAIAFYVAALVRLAYGAPYPAFVQGRWIGTACAGVSAVLLVATSVSHFAHRGEVEEDRL